MSHILKFRKLKNDIYVCNNFLKNLSDDLSECIYITKKSKNKLTESYFFLRLLHVIYSYFFDLRKYEHVFAKAFRDYFNVTKYYKSLYDDTF